MDDCPRPRHPAPPRPRLTWKLTISVQDRNDIPGDPSLQVTSQVTISMYLLNLTTEQWLSKKQKLEAMPDLFLVATLPSVSLYIRCCSSQVFRSIEEKLLAPHPYGIMWL